MEVSVLHLPHFTSFGFDFSEISIFDKSKIPIFLINSRWDFKPTFCAILIEPILEDLTKIFLVFKFFLSFEYSNSLISNFPHLTDDGNLLNLVLIFIIFCSKAFAIVKILNTEPNSYNPIVFLLIRSLDFIDILLLRSKSGRETAEIILPVLTLINIAEPPLALNVEIDFFNISRIIYCTFTSRLVLIGTSISFLFFIFSSK